MSQSNSTRARLQSIAMSAIFTALYVVLQFVPYTVMIGGAGAFLSLSDFLAPLYGVILGPYWGGLSLILGNFAALGIGRPPIFYGLDFLPNLTAAVAVGFLTRRKWTPAVILNGALLAIFLLNPLTSVFVFSFPFAWLHIVAFALLLSPLSRIAGRWVKTMDFKKISVGVAALSLIGTMIQHLTGNILFEVLLGQLTSSFPAAAYAGIWSVVFFVYPVERTILIVSAVLVGTPLMWIINNNHMLQPAEKRPDNQQAPTEPKKGND
ncbi:hypothetical protein MUP77_13165 [Candidatus Bathyarchaeota archaeon]|nr:hypothetical protein [Candidatus Bathyarchaeota archaeon]